MPFNTISQHAPTGYNNTRINSNPYDPVFSRNVPFPSRFSVYIQKISEADGSQSIVEYRTVNDLIGNKLYLYHRPLATVSGTATTITVGGGGSPVVDSSATNVKQAYIVFSTLPTADFTVSYTAVPDCISATHINVLQDDIMELQKSLGVNSQTGYPGLKNLAYGTFDNPSDSNLSGAAQRAVYLSHLNQNIVVGSTNDPALVSILGTNHTVQLGRGTDNLIFDTTGFTITQSSALLTSNISLGIRTGDRVTYKGSFSGAGQMTIGGSEWPGYSGVAFTTGLTGSFYSGAMLRVHGNVAVMGGIKSIGSITVLTATGETSVVMGDWTVRDELFVDGTSHLNGPTETNRLEVNNHLYVDGNIICNDQLGNGGAGQSLVDNLDCSEIAHNYKTVTKRRLPNSVIDGRFATGQSINKLDTYSPFYYLNKANVVGDIFSITGVVNAPAGPSGVHPNVIQVNVSTPIVSGTYGTTGTYGGVWSPGMMDPGSMWVRVDAGQAAGFTSPVYGYTFETGNISNLLGINLLCPELVEPRATTNDKVMIFNPNNILYNYLTAVGGASPTFSVQASSSWPLKVSFNDEVRIMTSNTANLSMLTALEYSVSGLAGTVKTGVAYILASMSGTDPENPPIFKARSHPVRMPNEVAIGEVCAYQSGGSWTLLDTISYRPGGIYDSCWLPIVTGTTMASHSGRFIAGLSAGSSPVKVYFQHHLGPDLDLGMSNIDLYLGTMSTGVTSYNSTHTALRSFQGGDIRAGFGDGSFLRIPLNGARHSSLSTARDASIFYLDGKVIGLQLTPNLIEAIPTGSGSAGGRAFDYMRLMIRRDV